MNRACLIVVVLVPALALAPLAAPAPPLVRVVSGLLSGVRCKDASIVAFKGIPYAAPPLGERRWQAPGPVLPWRGVRKATTFGASCIQDVVNHDPLTYEFLPHNEISEDCLYLNVWTTAASTKERRPVFVFIHGGYFRQGSSAVPVYDGEGLAKKGVVVVTVNYRLGVFGFLAHPELSRESTARVSGNYGLLDQIAALKWVRDNIAAFGGDPTRVTIAGQSAGGQSVHCLIASPLAKGLFRAAIVQSGGSSASRPGTSGWPRLSEAETEGVKFAESRGARSLAALRAMSWQKLTEVPQPASAGGQVPPSFYFLPIIDGYLMPAPVASAVTQGRQNDVPTLTGIDTEDYPRLPVTLASYIERTKRGFGVLADEALKLYPATTDTEAVSAADERARDDRLVSLYLWAKQRAATARTAAFVYLWDHAPPGPDAARFGAFHSSEVPYFMNTLYASERPFTDQDRRIAALMSSYIANFVKSGDPNGVELPRWERVGDKPQVMEIGDKTAPIPVVSDPAKYRLFDTLYSTPTK